MWSVCLVGFLGKLFILPLASDLPVTASETTNSNATKKEPWGAEVDEPKKVSSFGIPQFVQAAELYP